MSRIKKPLSIKLNSSALGEPSSLLLSSKRQSKIGRLRRFFLIPLLDLFHSQIPHVNDEAL